jgi:hypothetical protein
LAKGTLHDDLPMLEHAFDAASSIFYSRQFPEMSPADRGRCAKSWQIFFELERRHKAEEYRSILHSYSTKAEIDFFKPTGNNQLICCTFRSLMLTLNE